MWCTSEYLPIQPLAYMRQPGRPRKVRIRDPHEKEDDNARKIFRCGGTITCSHCHETGHNVLTCHRLLPPRPKTASRPRKNPDVRTGPNVPNTETATMRSGRARGS